jgi:hypothetical protein
VASYSTDSVLRQQVADASNANGALGGIDRPGHLIQGIHGRISVIDRVSDRVRVMVAEFLSNLSLVGIPEAEKVRHISLSDTTVMHVACGNGDRVQPCCEGGTRKRALQESLTRSTKEGCIPPPELIRFAEVADERTEANDVGVHRSGRLVYNPDV